MDQTQQSDLFSPQTTANEVGSYISAQSTLPAVLRAFEQHMREEGFSQNTIKSFASDGRLLHKFIEDQPVGELSTEDLNKFLNWLVYERGVPCSPKSYARRVTTLKVLFGWLTDSGILVVNPAEAVVQMSVTSPLPTIPNDDQLDRALEVSRAWITGKTIDGQPRKKDARPHLLLTLLLLTGCKKGEAKGLFLEHILKDDEDDPEIFIRYNNPRLRYKERKLVVDREWIETLDAYVEQYRIKDEIFTCTPRNLEYILRDISDEAGLERGLISFENLRWSSALLDLKKGMEPELIREKMGLSKISWRETKSKLEKLWDIQKEEAAGKEEEEDSAEQASLPNL